ncbi:MAG: LacI family DNA-binding transcriptional regulator [Lachnospiraceae bacterium]|nr:LacI family DNA-binding transcriptional regulator [Lachnospiraceae bacterium]
MAKNITMKDIADKLGVSTVTVSKALTNREGVSDEVREKVKAKAEEMRYRYNSAAKAMKEGNNGNIGILIANRFFEDNSFYNNLYRNIILKLTDTSFFGLLEIISQEQEEQVRMPNVITNGKIDGLIIMGQVSTEYLEEIKKTEIPFVFLDFYTELEEVESVNSDNIYGSYRLTNYLVQMGHREIAFIGNINATSSIMDRYLGCLKSQLQHGLPHPPEWLISDRDDKGKFLEYQLPEHMPTAFVCNCDQVAYQLINNLKSLGYRVPQDISVVGFDDYIYATLADPQLTTFRVDMGQMASASVLAIIKKIRNHKYVIGRKVIGGDVIVRDSVAKRSE